MKIPYMYTNESLEAISAGLQISPEDTVVAVGGSGDQAFAMLEYAGRVKVFDTDPLQLAYIRERAEALAKGDYERFTGSDKVSLTNLELSLSARAQEKRWSPAVYQKAELKAQN